MSVCNIYVGPGVIMCLSDTVSYEKKRPAALSEGKTYLFPGGGGAWCFRGRVRVGMSVEFFIKRHNISSLDDLEDRLEYYSDILSDLIEDDNFGEITLMGHSENQSRLRAVRYRLLPEGGLSDPTEIGPGIHLQPSPGSSVKLPNVATQDTMVKLALAQHRVAKHFNMPMCIGGLMHLTTVTTYGAERRIVGAYPDYEDLKKQFDCPLTEEYRDFLEDTQPQEVA